MTLFVRILQTGTLLSTVAFLLSVLYQIYARFLLASAPPWTEEASRLFFLYAMGFAAGLALKDQEYVFLDILYRRLSKVARVWLDHVVALLISMLFLVMAGYGVEFFILGLSEQSPSMRIPMAVAFGSIIVMAEGLFIFSLVTLFKKSGS
ncbi:TRAP transporter small permease [Marinoscillum furvescens]|uniref:TRAP-type C4-dicarboxylate transport system permease small subunit n=1 Tax=Marinoscillum furvescens DSM 4134 TaxID=1122208 RepID=A0A3D9KXB1_MARFU|nr:TRAP transporter small permease subunit [Marinoscillum furvescens]RED93023.1 TRAP-type C4-dicarboxylate transport system permease small subunit [Marinoscillum furvescens DSM 4134]